MRWLVHAWRRRLPSAKSQIQTFATHLSGETQKHVEDQGFLPFQPRSGLLTADGSPPAIHTCLTLTRLKDFCILTFQTLPAPAQVDSRLLG